ncbi:PhnD/SsuA/transferrin family substrate-binding protein [Mycoplasmopsis lipofaciens]|uniref:PhnD/SsuA/transferrin family substrate-binding protein n=1 Tax=Mycoplasmopsis lipofaciens TaxID=114884 RepID=UPI0009FE5FCE|nr:PhnD/SsuA/transferrin family substrate-binding protein [Mycoplasmopsis lipofaciens]
MKKNTKWMFTLGTLSTTAVLPFVSAACSSEKYSVSQEGSYDNLMTKLGDGDVTVAGAWSDARFYAKEEAKNIFAIGATEVIANDGIQARNDLKAGDIEAIQKIFIDAVKLAKKQAKDYSNYLKELKNNPAAVEPTDKSLLVTYNNKTQSVFKIYNHDGYSKVNLDSLIPYNTSGEKKKAYTKKPLAGSDYFTVSGNSVTKIAGAKEFRIMFIPSSDPTYVQNATTVLSNYIRNVLGIDNVVITVSKDYNAAAEALNAKTQDVAFLPVETWAQHSGDASFILQAGRDVQIIDPYKSTNNTSEPALGVDKEKELVQAMNNYKEFNNKNLYISADKSKRPTAAIEGKYGQDLFNAVSSLEPVNNEMPIVNYYRSYIFARKDSKIYELVTNALNEQGSNWKLKWDDVKKYVKFGYTSNTSSSSYVYPEQWFIKHFEGFEHF